MTLAVPFVAISMLAIEIKRPYVLFACTFFILLRKEHFGVMAVGFGILWHTLVYPKQELEAGACSDVNWYHA